MKIKIIDTSHHTHKSHEEEDYIVQLEREVTEFIQDKTVIDIKYTMSIEAHRSVNNYHKGGETIHSRDIRSCLIMYNEAPVVWNNVFRTMNGAIQRIQGVTNVVIFVSTKAIGMDGYAEFSSLCKTRNIQIRVMEETE